VAGRALDSRRLQSGHAELRGLEGHERKPALELGDRHVYELAVFDRTGAQGELRRVRIHLHHPCPLPFLELRQAQRRLLRPHEVRDAAHGARTPANLGGCIDTGPDALAHLSFIAHGRA
jgi:hypothetical protein